MNIYEHNDQLLKSLQENIKKFGSEMKYRQYIQDKNELQRLKIKFKTVYNEDV